MKYPRRYTRITYEGVSFMSVLAFIILGSIIRQINLLVLLSGLMIAPFFFNWRISMKMMERLRATRKLPDWVHAATPFSVRWHLANDRERIPSWAIRIVDRVRRVSKSGAETSRRADEKKIEEVAVMAPPIPAATSMETTFRCFLPKRGVYEFGPAEISTAFPVGLIRSKIRFRECQSLFVAPRLGQLTRSWTSLLAAPRSGEQTRLRRRNDHDGEFYAIRPWKSGDSRRQVHWRSSARQGELMVRQLEQDTDDRLVLVLDLHDHDTLTSENVEFALSFFATVVTRSARSRGKVAAGIFGNEILTLERMDRNSVKQAMICLARLGPRLQLATEQSADPLIGGIRSLAKSNRSRIVILSTRGSENSIAVQSEIKMPFRWIDLSAGEGDKFFQMSPDETSEFIHQSVSDSVVAVS